MAQNHGEVPPDHRDFIMLGLPNHEGEEWNDAFGVVAGYFLQGIRGMAADGRLG